MIELYLGDCLVEMDKIADHSIDAIICDLPYGTTACKWDTVIPFEPLWEQYKRIIKPRGAIVLFGSQPFTSALVMSNVEWFRYEWIWEKDRGANFLQANIQPLKAHENVLVFGEYNPDYNPQKTNRKKRGRRNANDLNNPQRIKAGLTVERFVSSDKYERNKRMPRTVQYYARAITRAQGGMLHPTQKPVPLLEYLIKTYTNEGEMVLDSTMGSGTCGVAAVNTGRSFVGIELDAGYFEIAETRIEKAQNEIVQLELEGVAC